MSADDFLDICKYVSIEQQGGDAVEVYEGAQIGRYIRLVVNEEYIDLPVDQAICVKDALTGAIKNVNKRSKE